MVTEIGSGKREVELLRQPWDSSFVNLVSESREFLLLGSPFITRSAAKLVGHCLERNCFANKIRIICLTNLRVESVLAGSLELEGLAELARSYPNFVPIHLPSLHAKVFVADWDVAIITSGNLTYGGLRGNCEYGFALRRRELVSQARRDFEGYASLGAQLTAEDLASFATEISGLRSEFQAAERRAVKLAGTKLKARLRAAEDRILGFRARKSNQAIFCQTIEYLLSARPMRTADLHPVIQQMHPDLCDDSVDRMIDGVNFGKRWKHWVRTAQQALKRDGRIRFDGAKWELVH